VTVGAPTSEPSPHNKLNHSDPQIRVTSSNYVTPHFCVAKIFRLSSYLQSQVSLVDAGGRRVRA